MDAISDQRRSIEEVHRSVHVGQRSFFWRLFAFAGPAFMVSVGYMDPGNWATDIEGGSRYGYALLWVLLFSNAMALLVQTLAARMGIVAGRDLAQGCRDMYGKGLRVILWLLAEVAIAACDLAEVIGTIIGINLLFGLPLWAGLIVTVFDTILLLAIQRLGIRKMEAFIVGLIFTIGVCFIIEVFWSRPDVGAALGGLLPVVSRKPPFFFPDFGALYIAIGMLGATVMPHNLYLHSALVQTRRVERTQDGLREACRFNFLDSFVAMNGAFFVNAAILILAAAAFSAHGEVVTSIKDAHKLLPQVLGPRAASTLFAIALICAGQSSTLTGTLAGQIVMEGFVSIRLRPWIRRLLTRLLAIIPAAAVIFLAGEDKLLDLLVLSQVVLSLQLPFAIIPLLHYTSDKRRMGAFVSAVWVKVLGWATALIIVVLNIMLVAGQAMKILHASGWKGTGLFISGVVIASLVAAALLLLWITLSPFFARREGTAPHGTADVLRVVDAIRKPQIHRIGVAVENVPEDAIAVSHAVSLARAHNAELILVHVVEGVGAQWYGEEASDEERLEDQSYIADLVSQLTKLDLRASGVLRYGVPSTELIRFAKDEKIDFFVLRAHGHGAVGDSAFGQTIETIRHAVKIPVLAVRGGK
jgi:manganese transport protein